MEPVNPGKPLAPRPTTPDRPAPGGPGVVAASTVVAGEPSTGTRLETIPAPEPTVRNGAPRSAYGDVIGAPMPALPTLAPVPDAFALLKALRHRWLLAVSVGLAFATATAAATWLLLPKSMNLVTATSKLMFRARETPPPFWVGSDSTDFNTFKQTQCDLMKTRPILQEAIRVAKENGLDVTESPNFVTWLEKQLKIEGPAEIVEISLTAENPRDITILVNAITHTYLRIYLEDEKVKRETRLARVEQFQRQNEKEMQALLDKVHKIKQLVDGKPRNPREILTLENFTALQKEYYAVVSRLEKLQIHIDFEREKQKSGVVAPVPENLMLEQLEKDGDYKKLLDERTRIQNLIGAYRSYAQEGSPLVQGTLKGYQGDLDAVESRLQDRRKNLQPRLERQLRDSKPDLAGRKLQDLEYDSQLLAKERDVLAKRYEEQAKEVEKYYKDAPQTLDSMLKEVERKQRVAESLGMEVEARRIEANNPPRVTLVQEAVQPEPRDGNRQIKTIILAGASAFLFVGFCTAWLEFRSRRIHSPSEVVNELGMRLLGTVPALTENYRLCPLSLEDAPDGHIHDVVTESLDGIRTMLLHEARHMPLRTLMVTSGVSSEGKTTFSSLLALTLARAGIKTLLVDSDFIRPTANELFEMPLEPGLSEVLRGDIDLAAAVKPTRAANLSFLAAGKFDRQVGQVLAKGGMQKLLERFKEEYEFIVFDSCPVLSVANTLLIGQHVDGVILSILRDVSQMPRVYAAYQRLASLGIRVIGSVFIKDHSEGYGYHGYYGYGYSPKSSSVKQE